MGAQNIVLTAAQKAAGATELIGIDSSGNIKDTPARVAAFQASIGAAAASHTHTASQVTDLGPLATMTLAQAQAAVAQVSSVNGKTGSVTLAKADVDLGNVDNTSDANKPVSTAQATAIGAKMDAALPALQTVFDGGTAAQKAAFQASVSGAALRRTTQAALRPVGHAVLSGATAVTRHGVIMLPMSVHALRMRLHNAHTGAMTARAAMAWLTGTADPVSNGAAWTQALFGGATDATIPAGSGTPPSHQTGFIDSDPIYVPSLAKADASAGSVIAYRSYFAAAQNTRFDIITGGPSFTGMGAWAAFQAGVDAVTTPGAFTSPTYANNMPPVELLLYSAQDIVPIVIGGGSTNAGQGDTDNAGFFWRAARSTTDRIYTINNTACAGSTTAASLERTLTAVRNGRCKAAIWGGFSTNDTDSAQSTFVPRLKAQHRIFIDECWKLGVQPVLATFQAPTGMSGTTNAQRKAVNQDMRDLATAGYCKMLDTAAFVSDETQATGTWKNAAWTVDGTHMTPAGNIAMADGPVRDLYLSL